LLIDKIFLDYFLKYNILMENKGKRKMKCQKNRACPKQSPSSLPDFRKKCTGCDKIGKDKKEPKKRK
jgi:hypothetical protein